MKKKISIIKFEMQLKTFFDDKKTPKKIKKM